MIGDHWMDITAARRANLRCAVGVLGEHLPEFFTPCPADILVTTLCELPDHFSLN
jgi:phosphoglycolate phosphatase-like HAD superfamily hydrolase